MTRYLLLNLVFLLIITMAVTLYTRQKVTKTLALTLLIMFVLTAVFDSLIIATGIVDYNTNNILNVYIGRAPVEDFAYSVAAVLMVGLLWEHYESKK